ncbi:MAG: alpha/beta hydrolase [Eubacteriales bacterium]|nr:alpha/beta hydrolase [Eubacteriales bacterium]
MDKLILKEQDFCLRMQQEVLPYLEKRQQELWLEREKGHKIHCVLYTADDPKGTVLISHGFTEFAQKYCENSWYFLQNGYNVCIPEYCGHGFSYRLLDDPSLVHVDDYKRYLQDLLFAGQKVKQMASDLPLVLYGHSMGGGIAAAAAAAQPDLFSKVILSSPMIQPTPGKLRFFAAKTVAYAFCLIGKEKEYIMGQGPYDGQEVFEQSSSTSKERFTYYKNMKDHQVKYQTHAASYRWFQNAARLNRDLMKYAWKHIQVPVMIIQAEEETSVSKDEMDRFADKIQKAGRAQVKRVTIPGTKHEIYSSNDDAMRKYWREILDFLK